MKPVIGKSQTSGSTLVITVVISALIGSVLCSYLVLISNRNQISMRALAWNSAIPVLEAGIEEALTHLHEDEDPTANYWTGQMITGTKIYWKRRDFPDGSYFYVTNTDVGTTKPTIYAAGYVKAPLQNNEYISRLVKVTTTNPPSYFSRAIAANGLIKLSGEAVVDGYNSSLGPYSLTNRNASGGVYTSSQAAKAIDVGSAHIYGMAVTGPGGTVSVADGSVGDLNQTSGMQYGWVNDNMNVTFQDNASPTGPTITPTPTRIGPSNVIYLDQDSSRVIYKVDNLISNSERRPIIVTGNSTLWVSGDFIVNGTGYVYIAPGASLKLYVGGNGSISGGGVVNDSTGGGAGLPGNFSYYGLPTSTSLIYSGMADFVGTINAPQAAVNISGGSSVFGAIICDTFTCSGGSGVHYDEGLRGGGLLTVTSWREI
jgi:hypothetical protein